MSGLKEKERQFYPLQVKKKIAEEVITGIKGVTEISRETGIPGYSIARWAKRYEVDILRNRTKEVLSSPVMKESKKKSTDDLDKRVEQLVEENIKLRKSLLESELKAEALNTLIDLAEENYGLSLRKNSGAKQSSE